jgi:adenine-specific DNA-methyltransferase
MSKHRKPEKKQINQYDHREAGRVNNPPLGLVTNETDRDAGKKTYAYDPHIDPSLQCDPHRSQIEKIVEVTQ